jgi:pyruvate dehydrogenase E1 component beta subunit
MALKTFIEAIRETMSEEMRRDGSVILLGEDVGLKGGVFLATDGLYAEFGEDRVIDTPLTESMIIGTSIGAAMNGLRPIAEIQFADFTHSAFDQLVSEASRIHYRSDGAFSCPLVLRVAYGAGIHGSLYHSQSIEAFYAHVPGLKVVAPSTPADAYTLLLAAIRDPNPVIFLEHELVYGESFPVPEDPEFVVPIGKARIARSGEHVTIAAFSRMVKLALQAADELEKAGISAEVIDLRSLRPFDVETVVASVKKTNRIVSVEEGWPFAGIGSEIAALMMEHCFDWLDAPPKRVAGKDVPLPYAANLERLAVPQVEDIVAAAREVTYR